jgi:ADP-heptose:LPS heptosyltransferase
MILIFPYAKQLLNGQENPKNYPIQYWKELLAMIKEPVVQVGVEGEEQLVPDFRKNLSMADLAKLVKECRTWISVDSFAQHFCWDLDKPGIVIFSQSDPNIFGHKENKNLLKDRKYLRPHQFWLWTQTVYDINAYVSPLEIYQEL